MYIIVTATDKIEGLDELLDAYDNADAETRQRFAGQAYDLLLPTVGGMIRRAAGAGRLGRQEVEGLAWEAILRGLAECGMPRLKRTDGNWDEFVQKIRNPQTPPARRIWGLLTDKLRRSLAAPYLKATTTDELVKELNDLFRRPDFYDPNSFGGVVMSDEGRQLLSRGGRLSASQLARFNALLLSSAFPEVKAPEQKPRNLLGYLSSTVIPQMKPHIWEAATGLPVDQYAIEVWNDLKPFIEQLDHMRAAGSLPEGYENLSRAQQIYQTQKRSLAERYGPVIGWWNEMIRKLQPSNPFQIKDRESLRDARLLLEQHPDVAPQKLWDGPDAQYYLPRLAVAPIGVKSIERMLAAGQPKSQVPESQAAPQAPDAQQSQSFYMAAQPGMYQTMANHVYSDPGYDVERAVAAFLSGTPQPTQQQIGQFIQSQPPQIAETINDMGFGNIAQEVDRKILEHAQKPQTQEWLAAQTGEQPQQAATAVLAVRREIFIRRAGYIPAEYRPLWKAGGPSETARRGVTIVTAGASRRMLAG